MHPNNIVYKGYRLSAKVARPVAHGSNAPAFAATVVISQVTATQAGDSYDVPQFARGGFASSPSKAVDVAILFGREVVDGLAGNGLSAMARNSHIRAG